MGGFYMKMSNVKTSTVSKSAYNSREKEYDETLGRTFNYSSKEDHVYHNMKLPEGCPEEWNDKETFWNANEKFETAQKTERHGKQFIIAIPQELTQEQTEKAINEFQEYFAKMGYASQADQHEPESSRSTSEVEKNRHVHVLTSARKITNGEFEKVKEKKVYANDVNEQGKPIYNPKAPDGQKVPKYDQDKLKAWEQKHGRKFDFKTDKEEIDKVQKVGARNRREWERVRIQDNPLDRRETVEAARAEWARICNSYLSKEQQIDHRSYERQGSDKVAQIHEGIGSHKEQDDRKEYNEQVKQLNKELDQAKQKAERQIGEKGEQSHEHRESETVSGDHTRSNGVGGRTPGRDRPQGQGEQPLAGEVEQLDIREETDRIQRSIEHISADPKRQYNFERREPELESRIEKLERESKQANRRPGEQTENGSGRANRPEEGKREFEKTDRRAAEADPGRDRTDDVFNAYGSITEVRERIRGVREQHNQYAEQEQRERQDLKGMGAKANDVAKASRENEGRFRQLRAAFNGIRSRVAELKEKIQNKVEEAFNKAQPKQKADPGEQRIMSVMNRFNQIASEQAAKREEARQNGSEATQSGFKSKLDEFAAKNEEARQRANNEPTGGNNGANAGEQQKESVLDKLHRMEKKASEGREQPLQNENQEETVHRRRGRHR